MSRYTRLVADPMPAAAVDADAMLVAVCAALALTPEQTWLVLDTLAAHPVTLEQRPGSDIDDALARVGPCLAHAKGVCLSPNRIWVLRLDWPGLVAHELTHVVQRLLGWPPDEHQAGRVADAVAP